jgi:hypothetical protein
MLWLYEDMKDIQYESVTIHTINCFFELTKRTVNKGISIKNIKMIYFNQVRKG